VRLLFACVASLISVFFLTFSWLVSVALRDLAASCPGLLPFKVYSPSVGVSAELAAGHMPVDVSFFTSTSMCLYERLLVARTIGKAISELHLRHFWCGRVGLDAIVAGANGYFGLSRYCVGKVGGYTIPTELVLQDIRDFGTRTRRSTALLLISSGLTNSRLQFSELSA
jgi:hypothetical protein